MMLRAWKTAIIVIAAAGVGSAAPAQVPIAPLAPNEVLLEVVSTGVAHNRADKITAHVTVSASAATAAEARRQVAAQVDRLSAAARAQGATADDIRIDRPQRVGFIGNEAYDVPDVAPRPEKSTSTVVIGIRLPNPNRFEAMREALEAAGAATVADPEFALSDDRAALEQAKADALGKGRAEAEAYARSLGMRVVRLARVSERATSEVLSAQVMQEMMNRLTGGVSADSDVETKASVGMDFVLGPAH
jgi:uncharacterized protein YggE